MIRSAQRFGLCALAVLTTAMFGVNAYAQAAAPADTLGLCPAQKSVPVALAAPETAALPTPPPQEVVKPNAYETSNKGFPRWSDFPPPPKDVPNEAEFARRVAVLSQTRDLFSVSVKSLQWDVSTPAAISAAGMATINPAYLVPIETMTCEQYAEFVRYKQKLATPPPIADN